MHQLHLVAGDIDQLHRLLLVEPGSSKLDQLFQEWGYPPSILDKLRHEDFSCPSLNNLGFILKQLLEQMHDKELKEHYLKSIRTMLIDDSMTLSMRCYLICRPELVRAFERKIGLYRTGDYYQCVKSYRSSRYTRQDMQILAGDLGDYLSRQYLYQACKRGHTDVIQHFLSINPELRLAYENFKCLIRRGCLDLFERYIGASGLSPRKVRRLWLSGGHMSALDMHTRLNFNESDDKEVVISGKLDLVRAYLERRTYQAGAAGVFVSAARYGRVGIVEYLLDVCPDYVANTLNDLKVFRGGIAMAKLVLNQYNVNALISSVPHSHHPEVIATYGNLLGAVSCRAIGFAAIQAYDYETFDLVCALMIKMSYDTKQLLESAIGARSKYFFDKLLVHSVRPTHAYEWNRLLALSVGVPGHNYFFKHLYVFITFEPCHWESVLRACIRDSNWEIFCFILPKMQVTERTRREACYLAMQLSRVDYFGALFIGYSYTEFNYPFFINQDYHYELPSVEILDIISAKYCVKVMATIFMLDYKLHKGPLSFIKDYTSMVLTYVKTDLAATGRLLRDILKLKSSKMEAILQLPALTSEVLSAIILAANITHPKVRAGIEYIVQRPVMGK